MPIIPFCLRETFCLLSDQYLGLKTLYPAIDQEVRKEVTSRKLDSTIAARHFVTQKRRAVAIETCLDAQPNITDLAKEQLVASIMADDSFEQPPQKHKTGFSWVFGLVPSFSDNSVNEQQLSRTSEAASAIPDARFLANLDQKIAHLPIMSGIAQDLVRTAHEYLPSAIKKAADTLLGRAEMIQHQQCVSQVDREVSSQTERSLRDSRLQLFSEMEAHPRSEKS